jgi:hypothetical protein
MTGEERQRFAEILAAAGGVEPGELSTTGRAVLGLLARSGDSMVEGVCNLVAAAYRAGYAVAEEVADRYEDGVPFFRHDATVTVTVSASELVEHGMPDNAVIGVAWELGDECIAHALAGAERRAEGGPDDRGVLIYPGWWLDCLICRAEAER